MTENRNIVPVERIESMIYLFRGQKVMIDADLAALYGVETGALMQAVNRNKRRFPEDFMFQLSTDEWRILKSQIVISSLSWGGRRKPHHVFTEQGVAMLSSVLKSDRAADVNVEIMRVFVRMRRMLAGNQELARKIKALEMKYDGQFKVVFDALKELMAPPVKETRKIGFRKS